MPIPQTTEQQAVTDRHNELVKAKYHSPDLRDFIAVNGNHDEGYLEIPGNETISGHVEIVEFDKKDFDFY